MMFPHHRNSHCDIDIMMKHLFLSPHYDDAIYSCGGTIYDLVQQGHSVDILTIMAGIPKIPLPDTPVLADNHQRWQIGDNPVAERRQEDQIASNIIGVHTQYTDILDCIYRTADGEACYPTEDSLWHQIHPNDPALKVLNALILPDCDVLYAPLGVGAHVDHLIVRDWAWQLAQKDIVTVQFYVEYPYLRDRQAVKRAYDAFPTTLNAIVSEFSEEAMQHKVRAMVAYQSQIASFWDDKDRINDEVRQTFTKDGQFVEEFVQA